MPAKVIERYVNVLTKTAHVGMNFTNMQNKEYDDMLDDNSEGDYDSDSDGSDSNYNNVLSDCVNHDYDDFIAGVNGNNLDPDPPTDTDNNDGNEELSVEDPIVEDNNKNANQTFNNDNDDVPEDDDNDHGLVAKRMMIMTTDW